MTHFNAVTQTPYSSTNQKHLETHADLHELNRYEWAGFKQWGTIGRKVKKGAKGCKIFMVCTKQMDKKNKREDTKKTVLKALYVFNIEHTEEI